MAASVFRRQTGEHRAVDLREPRLDHVDRAAGKSELTDCGIDPCRFTGESQRDGRPSVERGMRGQFGSKHRAHRVEGRVVGYVGHRVPLGDSRYVAC